MTESTESVLDQSQNETLKKEKSENIYFAGKKLNEREEGRDEEEVNDEREDDSENDDSEEEGSITNESFIYHVLYTPNQYP